MIILDLVCNNQHRFEGWFASRDAFDLQCGQGLVLCTLCQSGQVNALPSGPRVLRNYATPESLANDVESVPPPPVPLPPSTTAPKNGEQVFKALATLARTAENVGERFPEEARRIHYEEAPQRNIRGVATREETRELLEEGILVLPAPVPPETETH